jgi:hypothetical protein
MRVIRFPYAVRRCAANNGVQLGHPVFQALAAAPQPIRQKLRWL